METKEKYMRRALELAAMGEGRTSPNPMVGRVVVKDGRIISEGYHEKYGEYHAERNALLRCKEDPAGADLYVTLEPCCHQGKTPPCTDIIIEKKIGRVFVGSLDSNPLVAGRGVAILRDSGIKVETGILEEECLKLNEVFYHYISTGTPFVAAKYAMSADGRIACASGDSKWITGEAARRQVHMLRKRYSGILVGIGTVLADDPMLNCREEEGVDPVRIRCDSNLRIPMASQIVKTAGEIPTIVAAAERTLDTSEGKAKAGELASAGVTVITAGGAAEGEETDLKNLMGQLAERKIDSVLIEGGSRINAAAFASRIVSKVYAYVGRVIIGREKAPGPVGGEGAKAMAGAVRLRDTCVDAVGEDICITGYPEYPEDE